MSAALASRQLGRRQSVSSLDGCNTSDSTCEPGSWKGTEQRTGSEHSDDKAKAYEEWEDVAVQARGPEALSPMESAAEHVELPEASAQTSSNDEEEASGDLSNAILSGSPSETQIARVNGLPVVPHRCRRMSLDQMLLMCKGLGIMPDLLARPEVVHLFKRAQHTGFTPGTGSSLHNFLSYEEFVDAIGQMAIKAYSKQPFSEEYPEAHEKVEAFLVRALPENQTGVKEQFLYGRLGRSDLDN